MIKIGCLQPEIHDLKSECYEEIEALFDSFMNENENCDIFLKRDPSFG